MLDGCPVEVRIAGPEDEDELMKLCRAKHADEYCQTTNPFAFVEERQRASLHRALVSMRNDPCITRAWCGVVGRAGEPIEGSVFLEIDSMDYSDDTFLKVRWSWVYPEFRKTATPKRLLDFSQALASEYQLLMFGQVPAVEEDSPHLRFYKRNGCKLAASMYLYSASGAA